MEVRNTKKDGKMMTSGLLHSFYVTTSISSPFENGMTFFLISKGSFFIKTFRMEVRNTEKDGKMMNLGLFHLLM